MPETMLAHDAPWTGTVSAEELEHRLQRLEDAVASLCDKDILDGRVRGLVAQEFRIELQRLKEAGADFGRAKQTEADLVGASSEEHLGDPPTRRFAMPWVATSFLWEIWSESTLLYRMIRDPHYSMSWSAKTIPIAALVYVMVLPFFSGWLLPSLTIPVLSQLVDLFVIYLGFKVLGRELKRYRDHLSERGA